MITNRLPMSFILLLLLSMLWGCGGSSGPTTIYDDEGIRANLPGTGWYSLGNSTEGSLVIETWVNPDETMMFRVASDPEEVLSSPVVQSSAVERYMSIVGYPPTTSTESGMLAGKRGIRLEAIQPGNDGYHIVEYAIVTGFQNVFVGAGARTSHWSKGGSEAVEDILRSVELTDQR